MSRSRTTPCSATLSALMALAPAFPSPFGTQRSSRSISSRRRRKSALGSFALTRRLQARRCKDQRQKTMRSRATSWSVPTLRLKERVPLS
ncbi:hypothetical protein BCR35DRAFT_308368 [Leucosporidium creatinivorum]|uniref:Secreted protein n=1 Tax=Leucosporidium creatinivorum TaxID=106004 RepID=A0A1Y2E7U8_9BASI|nr:hypothetical protein BCR35DRAFT_308368 [Leucosporidium creatinivorum]